MGLLFNSFGLAIEVQASKNMSFETNAIYGWKQGSTAFWAALSNSSDASTTLGLNMNLRYYINDSDKKLDRFYAGTYTNIFSQSEKNISFSGVSTTTRESFLSLGFLVAIN